ncbi:CAP domain-containing protein [Streptomyces pacificus]|uniref:CAP domain-containing protein n=1 Tax=Streptomyces pacificus TaxID=2705029 RepID=A0A6A0ARE9_9ACTN|nr:CAP domain-containing protein [Streptomyces pacificus]GFH35490.1 CAP domain-containing protein [Streptomyces pacificus]
MGRHRRKKRVPGPVRNGLLGIAAAAAVGAVAVAAGLVPGGGVFTAEDGKATARQVSEVATGDHETLGGASSSSPSSSPSPSPAEPAPRPSRDMSSTSGKDSPSAGGPSASPPAQRPPTKTPAADGAPASKAPGSEPAATPGNTGNPAATANPENSAPERRAAPAPTASRPEPHSDETAAAAEVLALVNEERAKAGCAPVHPDASLARLAGGFSADMAARNFFDHTDPEGRGPWDRAALAGVSGLGAENIARGQADAPTVMNAWMSSDGHRANILNCDYRTLGVGVSFAQGGPWWTQDFGF